MAEQLFAPEGPATPPIFVDPMIHDRFVRKIRKTELCWFWEAAHLPNGYGRFSMGGKPEYAHRAAWLIFRGAIPDGLDVCHTCDVRDCVRPDHLFAGTRSENIRDMIIKGRAPWQIAPGKYIEAGRRVGLTQRGAQHSRAKLSDLDIEIIRYLAARGAFFPDIAKVFDITKGHVGNLVNERKK